MAPATRNPKEIEAKSFEIIGRFLTNVKLPAREKEVLKRVIHATARVKYSKDLLFHPRAVSSFLSAIRKGNSIIVDASMVKAGINEGIASSFGSKVICLINDRDVIRRSRRLNVSRAILAMRKSARFMNGGVIAIGNAPTALFEVCDLIEEGQITPAVVISVPLWFVGAKEAKRRLRTLKVPYISNSSRMGGSSAAAACVNALLKINQLKKK